MLWGVRQRVEPAGDNFLRGFIIAWGFMRSQIVTLGKKKGTEFLLGLFFFMQLVFFYIFLAHIFPLSFADHYTKPPYNHTEALWAMWRATGMGSGEIAGVIQFRFD